MKIWQVLILVAVLGLLVWSNIWEATRSQDSIADNPIDKDFFLMINAVSFILIISILD